MKVKLSREAAKVWRFLLERGNRHLPLRELTADLHMSKTAIQRALLELDDAQLISYEEDV